MHYGAPRDLLLGLRFINSQGKIVSAGGKVVKNVAGYDMTRLLAGSAGTLGFITALTLRLATVPEYCAAATARGNLADCLAVASTVLQSNLTPSYAAALSPKSGDTDPAQAHWELMIGFEGFSKTVNYQLEKLEGVFNKGNLENLDQIEYPLHEGPFAEIFKKIGTAPYILRAGLPLNAVHALVRNLNNDALKSDVLLDLGCGRIFSGFESVDDDLWEDLCASAQSLQGHVVLDKAPDEFKQRRDVFGAKHPEWKMIHRVKAALDPHNVFSPGRLPGKL
jgi:FAD/FMN-containing dehydrogenase